MSDETHGRLFQRMAVIGVGLIGSSLARSCRGRISGHVIGLDADRSYLERTIALGFVDEGGELPAGVEGADLVVVAVPVGAIGEVVSGIAPYLADGCIVTDVGSVKGDLVAEVEAKIPAGRAFVPGHPIAGTERSGPEAASAGLFEGSLCVLTPTSKTPDGALQKVSQLWERLGSRVVMMDPFRHDQVFALVSHLPHVVAYALMGTILGTADGEEEFLKFSAGGLRDFTRIAASHPIMWRDILIRNREEVLKSIAQFRAALQRIEEMMTKQDSARLMKEFERAKEVREQLR